MVRFMPRKNTYPAMKKYTGTLWSLIKARTKRKSQSVAGKSAARLPESHGKGANTCTATTNKASGKPQQIELWRPNIIAMWSGQCLMFTIIYNVAHGQAFRLSHFWARLSSFPRTLSILP